MDFKNWLINEASESIVTCSKHDYEYGKRGVCPYCRDTYPVCSSCGENIELGEGTRDGAGPTLHKTCVGKPLTFLKAIRGDNHEDVPNGVRKMSDDLHDYKGHGEKRNCRTLDNIKSI